jgi:cyclic beta-1,2-glucan synthetase
MVRVPARRVKRLALQRHERPSPRRGRHLRSWLRHQALAPMRLQELEDEDRRQPGRNGHREVIWVQGSEAEHALREGYLRAYFDDGTPLGSHAAEECRIDSIAQAWAVISGVAPPAHAARAMASVDRDLVFPDEKLLLVLTPPFDKTTTEPGYIKGYPPGIRENGGQYTHAALWTAMAFALLGEGNKAAALFAMLNPINHARTPAEAARYKLEPYVVAADIYSTPPHVGRGGWSWYTGSAGWMQRVGLESILGLRIRGSTLHIDPCIPRDWPRYDVTITWRSTRYVLAVENSAGVSKGVASVNLDGVDLPAGSAVPLVDDGATHAVRVTLGCTSDARAA